MAAYPSETQPLPPAALAARDGEREATDSLRILADQVELLYRHASLGIVVSFIIGGVLAFELYSTAKIGQLVICWPI